MASDSKHPKEVEEYAAAFQRGEEQGFTYFFKTLYPALLYYAYNMVKMKELAEKIVEDTFIQVWANHEHLHSSGEIRDSLYTTSRKECIKRGLVKGSQEDNPPVNDIILAEVIGQVHTTIKDLPPQYQKIFEMLYIQGKTIREVATELKLSVETVGDQRAHGLAILRKKFPDIFPG